MRMTWRIFFNPTPNKLGFFLWILLLSTILSPWLPSVYSASPQLKLIAGGILNIGYYPIGIGFPRFFIYEFYIGPVQIGASFFPISMMVNIVLWYPLSCLLSLWISPQL